MLAKRVLGVEYAIRDVLSAALELEKKGKKIYHLNIGDPAKFDFAPPMHLRRAYAEAVMDKKYACYGPSEGEPELREEIGKREGVCAEDVFITAGVSEAISFLFASLLNPKENILQPSPGYPLYTSLSRFYGGIDNFYECDENWIPNIDDIRRKINEKTKAIVVINPNNPTGAVYGRKIVKEIVNIGMEHNIPIISDEVYCGLEFEKKAALPAKISKDALVISVNGISKLYLYPGARGGYLAFHNHSHNDSLENIKEGIGKLCRLRLCTNYPMQRGMLAAYKGSQKHIREAVKKLRKRRNFVFKRLNEIEGIECAKPKAAFYAFPKVLKKWKNDKEFVTELLNKTGVLVVPGSGFSPILKGVYFRIVFLPNINYLNEALNKIKEFMGG